MGDGQRKKRELGMTDDNARLSHLRFRVTRVQVRIGNHSLTARPRMMRSAPGLARSRRLGQPPRQIAIAVHRSAHQDILVGDLVKEDVPLKGTKDDEESPGAEPRMSESALWTQVRVLPDQTAGCLHCIEVPVCHLTAGLDRVPFELMLYIRNEVVRFADAHDGLD